MQQIIEIFEPVSENLKTALSHIDTIADYHQAIMDIAYNNLKSMENPDRPGTYNVAGWRQNKPWSHALLTGSAQDTYGDLAEFAVLVGKYHQQVCNGGHLQYWNNHYASDGDITEDIILHVRLENRFQDFIDDVENFLYLSSEDKEVLFNTRNIMRSFRDQLELEPKYEAPRLVADEEGEIYEFDSEDSNCDFGSPTDWCRRHWNMLDEQYYKINGRLVSILEDYFREKIIHG